MDAPESEPAERGPGDRAGRGERRAARLEEIPLAEAERDAGRPAGRRTRDRLCARLRAGLLVDLGRVPAGVLARWQERVVAGEFDADACAEELVAAAGEQGEHGDHLEARSRALLRDFVMAPRQRGRAVRGAARSGAAMLLTHVFTLAVYTLLIVVGLLLLRARGVEVDRLLDNLLGWVPSLRRG